MIYNCFISCKRNEITRAKRVPKLGVTIDPYNRW